MYIHRCKYDEPALHGVVCTGSIGACVYTHEDMHVCMRGGATRSWEGNVPVSVEYRVYGGGNVRGPEM